MNEEKTMAYVATFIMSLIVAGIIYFLARRKNLKSEAIALFSGGISIFISPILVLIVALIILAFTHYRCPKCESVISNADASQRKCSKCNRNWDGTELNLQNTE